MADLVLETLLAKFRAMETNEDAAPIIGDDDAMKVLSSWSKVDQAWRKPRGKAPVFAHDNHGLVWAWIRSGWTCDIEAVAAGAGVSERVAVEKLAILIGNRLIYPDGSTARGARIALQVWLAAKLGLKSKPAKAKRSGDDDLDDAN